MKLVAAYDKRVYSFYTIYERNDLNMFNKLNTFIRGLFSSNKKEGAAAHPAAVPADVKTEVTFLHPSGKVRQRDKVRHTYPVTTIEETRKAARKEVKQAAPKMSVRQWIKSVNEYDSIRNKLAM